MKITTPTLEEVRKLAWEDSYGVIPVSRELFSDDTTPIEVLRRLKKVSRHTFLLESAEDNQRWGRYSFLGYAPVMEIRCSNGDVTVTKGKTVERFPGNPKDYIRSIMADYRSPVVEGMPPFTGGLTGYFSYDYIKYSEPSLVLDAEDKDGFYDVDMMLFDKVICFDHYKQKIILIKNIKTACLEEEYALAEAELEHMAALLARGEKEESRPFKTADRM